MRFLIGLITLVVSSALADDSIDQLQIDHSIIPASLANEAVLLRERALLDNLPVDLIESLTTEVGARRVGTEGDRRAIAWAVANFEALGFDRVWTEEINIDHGWIRGEAKAEIVAPYPHDLVLTALGYSVGTGGDLIGEVVEFPTFDDLLAVPEGDSLAGKIAFVSFSMADYEPPPGASRMSGYGQGTRARGRGHVDPVVGRVDQEETVTTQGGILGDEKRFRDDQAALEDGVRDAAHQPDPEVSPSFVPVEERVADAFPQSPGDHRHIGNSRNDIPAFRR